MNPGLRTPQLPATHARAETGHRALTWDHTIDISRPPFAIHLHRATSCRTTEFVPFLDYAVEIRRVLCSTNAIESLNARYRGAVWARGHFPTEQAALKCRYLVTRSLDPVGQGRTRWTMRWKPVIDAFAITFSDRWPGAEPTDRTSETPFAKQARATLVGFAVGFAGRITGGGDAAGPLPPPRRVAALDAVHGLLAHRCRWMSATAAGPGAWSGRGTARWVAM